MEPISPRHQRIARIEEIRMWADDLLSLVNRESMKSHVHKAVDDLDEAMEWLNAPDIDQRPQLLNMVDASIKFAMQRLAHIEKTLVDRGSDATFI